MSDRPSSVILPAHIEDTIHSIAALHGEHHRQVTPVQRVVEKLTAATGRPRTLGAITILFVAWIAYNLAAPTLHLLVLDAPPFEWLATAASAIALCVTVMILTTQRRENALAELREQLTLELAILSEQKSAKTIALLEEIRRDSPHLPNRYDPEAEEMALPADPGSVFEAIRETHAEAQLASTDMEGA